MAESSKSKFFYGYVIVAAAFCTTVIAYGALNTFGVFFTPLLTEFGWTRAMTAGAFSLHMLFLGFFSIIAGRFTDKFGPRIVISACGLILGSGYLLMSRVTAIWQLYLFYGVMIGTGMSGSFAPLVSTAARWFARRRGLATGIVVSGAGLGTLIMAPLANWLISIYDWRTSYIIIGITAWIFMILAAQFMKRDPWKVGLLPYGANEARGESLGLQTSGLSFHRAVRTGQFWALFVTYLCFGFSLYTILIHAVPHVIGLGVSPASAASILGVLGGVSVGGRIIMGGAGDRIGNRLGIIISFILLAIALLWLQLAREVWMLYLFAVIFGFAFGGLIALEAPIAAELFGLGSHGVLMGTIGFGFTIGGAAGSVVTGHIFDMTGSYQIAFFVGAALAVLGILLTLLLHPVLSQGGRDDQRRSA